MAVVLFWPFSLVTFIYVVFPPMFFPPHRFCIRPSLFFFLIETSERHFAFLGSRGIGSVAEHVASSSGPNLKF